MAKPSGGGSYPEPFVVEARDRHKTSVILLHGRGSNGEKFGTELLKSHTTLSSPVGVSSSSMKFADMLPDTKFIFPTARKRRAKWYNRATINQWFDSVPIDEQDEGMSREEEEWQLEGLRQSRAFLKSVVDEEVNSVGAANVFIGGLSQGCAMSLHLLLSYEELNPLAGFIGMSGWLPFADDIEALLRPEQKQEKKRDMGYDSDEDSDPFATSDSEQSSHDQDESPVQSKAAVSDQSVAAKVCNLVRDNMDLPPIALSLEPCWLSTPVFLGHGKSDERVTMTKGLRAAECLRNTGLHVTWKEYDEGHWYAVPDEIDDITQFMQSRLS